MIKALIRAAGLTLAVLPFTAFSADTDGARTLLADILKENNSITEYTPTKDRIRAYKKIFSNLELIISDYPTSDEAITLLSTGTLVQGGFNSEEARSEYIRELTDYYSTVCEVSPSLECIGFVSLNSGASLCPKATTFQDARTAHAHIGNAINVFVAQESDRAFVDLALNTYRACSAQGKVRLNEYQKEGFASELVGIFLKLQKTSAAKATIENMETPYFKFRGVLQLKAASSEQADQTYVDRLKQFLDEKVNGKDRVLGELELLRFMMDETSLALPQNITNDIQRSGGQGNGWLYPYTNGSDTCQNDGYPEVLADTIFDLNRAAMQHSGTSKNALTAYELGMFSRAYLKPALDACANPLSLPLTMAMQVTLLEGPQQGGAFWDRSKALNPSTDNLYLDYINTVDPTITEIQATIEACEKQKDGPLASLNLPLCGPTAGYQTRFVEYIADDPAIFPIFQRVVDAGDVCLATTMLFQRLAKRPQYGEAIAYIINSSAISPDTTHSCGDEELELLLN